MVLNLKISNEIVRLFQSEKFISMRCVQVRS